jgi:hypothetical protein
LRSVARIKAIDLSRLRPDRAVAKAIGAKLAVPKFKDATTKPSDFNDLHQLDGLDTVKTQIEAATEAESQTPTSTTDFRDLIHDAPKGSMPGDNHLLSQTADAVGKILANQNIFSRGGLVFTLDKNRNRLILMTPDTLRTRKEEFLILYRIREVGAARESIEFPRAISEAAEKGGPATPVTVAPAKPLSTGQPWKLPARTVPAQNSTCAQLPHKRTNAHKFFCLSLLLDAKQPLTYEGNPCKAIGGIAHRTEL